MYIFVQILDVFRSGGNEEERVKQNNMAIHGCEAE